MDLKLNKLRVLFSPVGAGRITSETQAGFYRVNEIAVGWFIAYNEDTEEYSVFDPRRLLASDRIRVYFIKDFDPIKNSTDKKNCVIIGSDEQFQKMVNHIGYFGKIDDTDDNL